MTYETSAASAGWGKGERGKEQKAHETCLVKVQARDGAGMPTERLDARPGVGRRRPPSFFAHHALLVPVHEPGASRTEDVIVRPRADEQAVERFGDAVQTGGSQRDGAFGFGEVEVPYPDLAVRATGDAD